MSECQCQIRNSPVAKFIIREWDIVDFGIGLAYRPANLYVAWLEGTTTQCRSQLNPPGQGLWIWLLGSIPASYGTVESYGRKMKQCWINNMKNLVRFLYNPRYHWSIFQAYVNRIVPNKLDRMLLLTMDKILPISSINLHRHNLCKYQVDRIVHKNLC